MPRIKTASANHLAASMDARMVKTARLYAVKIQRFEPQGGEHVYTDKIEADSEEEAIAAAREKAGEEAFVLSAEMADWNEDEEGVVGDECMRTGEKTWECPCWNCEEKRRKSEEGTDEPADLSVEEELMKLEARRDQMKKRADMFGDEPGPPEEGSVNEALEILVQALSTSEFDRMKWKILDELRSGMVRWDTEEMAKSITSPLSLTQEEKDKVNRLIEADPKSFVDALYEGGVEKLRTGSYEPSFEWPEELEEKWRGNFKDFKESPRYTGAPNTEEEWTDQGMEAGRKFFEEAGRPIPANMKAYFEQREKDAVKLTIALTKISETLDRAGLEKSAYATLRTLQVLQKEIK